MHAVKAITLAGLSLLALNTAHAIELSEQFSLAITPQVLSDYIEHGTLDAVDAQGRPQRVLAFDREIETAIYNTLPHNLDRLLRRHPLQCPVAFLGGTRSLEMKQVGMSMTLRLVGKAHPERLRMIEGTHLFPMERPLETAAAIDDMLGALASAERPPPRRGSV